MNNNIWYLIQETWYKIILDVLKNVYCAKAV